MSKQAHQRKPVDQADQRPTRLGRSSAAAAAELSLALEALGHGFVLYDRDDRLVLCNRRYHELFPSLAPAAVPGARFEEIVRFGLARGQFAGARGQEDAWLARHLAEHRAAYSCTEQELDDGRWVQVIDQATPEGGRIRLGIEITEGKRQEARALLARRQLEATLKAIPDLLFEVDRKGRFLASHVADPDRLLLPPEQLIGKTVADTMPADVAPICRAALDEALLTGTSTGKHYRLEGARGDEWYELSIAKKDTEDGPAGTPAEPTLIVLVRDVTERKRLEQSLEEERNFLDQIMATSLSAIVVVDAGGRLVFSNKAAEQVLGIDASTERCFDDPALRVSRLDGSPCPEDQLPCAVVLRTGEPAFDVRLAIDGPDGRRRLLSVNSAPLAASSNLPRRAVCSVTDITDQLQAEAALRHKETLLRGLFELCPLGIALTEPETGRFIEVNDAVLQQLGYSRDELLNATVFDVTPAEYHEQDRRNKERLVQGGAHRPNEKENIRKDGSRFPVIASSTLVTDAGGRKLLWSIVEDITERKATEARILSQAHYDELTGLPNRRLFRDKLEQALERARRGRHIGAVAMLDLDHFKTINDSLGHKAGDQVLIEVAARLGTCTRATDTVARFGGDEFLLLLDDIKVPDDAAAIARKIHGIFARPFIVDDQTMQLGVSIGICIFDADHAGPNQLLRHADLAMYAAKSAGRNRTRFFEKREPSATVPSTPERSIAEPELDNPQ